MASYPIHYLLVFRTAFLFLLLGIWTSSCEPASKSEVENTSRRFRTTPPSHLYFKNIRSSVYEQVQEPGTRIDQYHLRMFEKTTGRPVLYPVIIDNWMEDEAYIQIKPNKFSEGYSDTLRVFWYAAPQRDSGRYQLVRGDWESQLVFAENLFQELALNHSLSIQTANGKRVPLFNNSRDRAAFLTTMRDYFRLTERE